MTAARTKSTHPCPYDIGRTDKGSEGQHWQVVENTWRVYAIKKPLQLTGSTITVAEDKAQYQDLMERHLAQASNIPKLQRDCALATSKPKRTALKNKLILAERDVEFGKFLKARIPDIEAAFETFERQREELERRKQRAAEKEAREARRIAASAQSMLATRATRSRARPRVNYAEVSIPPPIQDWIPIR